MTRERLITRGTRHLPLVGILALAAILRFADLTSRGFIYWDEGKFALEGIRLQAGLQTLLGSHVYLLAGKAVGTAKPMHALFIALAYFAAGIHDYSPLLMNAAASTGTVALTYVIANRLFGVIPSLTSAMLLAVSEYDVIYARSALSESDANVLLLAGVMVWVCWGVRRTRPSAEFIPGNSRALVGAGVLMGAGFATNYRLLVFIAIAVFADLIWSWRQKGAQIASLHALAWTAGLLVVPCAWQLIGSIANSRGGELFYGEVERVPLSYWREVIYQLHQGKQATLHFNPLIYVQWWVLRQGWPSSLLLAAGLGYAALKRSFRWLVPASLVAVPYGVYIFAPFVVPRNLAAALPFASIVTGAFIWEAAKWGRRYGLVTASFLVLTLALLGTWMSWRLTSERSGFAAAVRYVNLHGGGKAMTSSEIPVFYLRGNAASCFAPAMPYSAGDLRAYIGAGYLLVILDRHNNSHLTKLVRERERRLARYPTLGPLNIGESPISSENSQPPSGDYRTEYVNVYELDPAWVPTARGGHATPCRRDKVT